MSVYPDIKGDTLILPFYNCRRWDYKYFYNNFSVKSMICSKIVVFYTTNKPFR